MIYSKIKFKSKNTRLKKNAEFYNYISNGKVGEVYVFKNPTGKEVDEIKNTSKEKGTLRAYIHSDGTVYIWTSDILHHVMKGYFPEIESDVHLELYHGVFNVYITNKIANAKQLLTYINATNLNILGISDSNEMYVDWEYYNAPEDEIYEIIAEEMGTIGDFKKLAAESESE